MNIVNKARFSRGETSLTSQTLSVPQRRSSSVRVLILKAIAAVERKGSGLRDYMN